MYALPSPELSFSGPLHFILVVGKLVSEFWLIGQRTGSLLDPRESFP
jgi:hypothetical protein